MSLRLCFVGLKCYDLIAGVPQPRYFGGAERQQVLLARGLAARGHQVSFVTLDFGQPDGTEHGGIRVWKAYSRDDGLPGLRFFHPRWSGLIAALRRSGAGVFLQMGGDSETGQVAAWCRRSRKAFVFSLASDADTDAGLPLLRSRRQRTLYRAGLQRANAIVAQTETQRAQLRDAFGLDSMVIRNCTSDPGFDIEAVRGRAMNGRPRLLWVGRLVPVKRLEVFLDVAAAEPGWDFHVVGRGDSSSDYVQSLERRAHSLPNVTLHGSITDEALAEQYRFASALVCTSAMEGVPITFLEAWARGLPVISTVDPDGVIAANGLGAIAAPAGLTASIQSVRALDQEALARRIRAHFLATHTIEAFVSRHERLLLEVSAANSPAGVDHFSISRR